MQRGHSTLVQRTRYAQRKRRTHAGIACLHPHSIAAGSTSLTSQTARLRPQARQRLRAAVEVRFRLELLTILLVDSEPSAKTILSQHASALLRLSNQLEGATASKVAVVKAVELIDVLSTMKRLFMVYFARI